MQLGKKSFYEIEDMKYEDAIELTNYHFATLCTLDSTKEEVSNFLNKNNKVKSNT